MPGTANIYTSSNGGFDWILEAQISANDGAADNYFGRASAISETTVVVGAPGYNIAQGAAYVFEPDLANPGMWLQVAKLLPSNGAESGEFGTSLSVEGDWIVVGAPFETIGTSSWQGAAYIFHRELGSWVKHTKLIASDGDDDDFFGNSVSISSDTILVGAPGDDDQGASSGSAYVFVWDGQNWTQGGKVTAADGQPNDLFGTSVAYSQGCGIIGAPEDDDLGSNSGAVYIHCDLLWDYSQFFTYLKIPVAYSRIPDLGGPVIYKVKYVNNLDQQLTIRRWAELTWPDGFVETILEAESIVLRAGVGAKEQQEHYVEEFYPPGTYVLTVYADDGNVQNASATFEKLARDGPEDDVVAVDQDILGNNSPNPFNPVTRIEYTVKDAGAVSLTVYNMLGQLVTTLIDVPSHPAGKSVAMFDGSELASGVYIYRLQTRSSVLSGKMILAK
jgi:hypothetical protein